MPDRLTTTEGMIMELKHLRLAADTLHDVSLPDGAVGVVDRITVYANGGVQVTGQRVEQGVDHFRVVPR